jgi:hypothetical protein
MSYTTFRQIEIFAKTVREKFLWKRDEILQKLLTLFLQVFVFAKGKKCFCPNPI